MNTFVILFTVLLQLLQVPSLSHLTANRPQAESTQTVTHVTVGIAETIYETEGAGERSDMRVCLAISRYPANRVPSVSNDHTPLVMTTEQAVTNPATPHLVSTGTQTGEIRIEEIRIPIQLTKNTQVYVRDRRKPTAPTAATTQDASQTRRSDKPQPPAATTPTATQSPIQPPKQSPKQATPLPLSSVLPWLLGGALLVLVLSGGLTNTVTISLPQLLPNRVKRLLAALKKVLKGLRADWKSRGDSSESESIKLDRLWNIGIAGFSMGAALSLGFYVLAGHFRDTEPFMQVITWLIPPSILLVFAHKAISNNIRRRYGWFCLIGSLIGGSAMTYLGIAYRLGVFPFK